uniref:Uncharacterized protein n=1 Tax=Rhizochromulina marina TaxID=1034831 RepID=A0A7S2SCS3_9STRA|eukprot:CAMPEP_0118986252 /NCGR_PEP_ID=MMETSP1173-20130426/41733_1 /TAXON_ID=1034831 /ORGANISM="Rhizochromulina marina cf, Strain CCMP1243" /LENGTH=311 /DNA_ID=CAMNT_0006937027 /DNA_START=35 /DNA_END=970 /DNA_ORIENTATION=-
MVGNWLEDRNYREARVGQFLHRKKQGTLSLQRHHHKHDLCSVAFSEAEGGEETALQGSAATGGPPRAGGAPESERAGRQESLSFGDLVCLEHLASSARVAVDPWDKALSGQEGLMRVTAQPSTTTAGKPLACARTVFKIVPAKDGDSGELVYGQHFRLESVVEHIEASACYLAACRVSDRFASPSTNRQLVYGTAKPSADTHWMVERSVTEEIADRPHLKKTTLGEPVIAKSPVTLIHRLTGVPLLVDPAVTEITDFGREFEVVCSGICSSHKVSTLARETECPSLAVRVEDPVNFWRFKRIKDNEQPQEG